MGYCRECLNSVNIKTLKHSPSFRLCCWTPGLHDFKGCIFSKTSFSEQRGEPFKTLLYMLVLTQELYRQYSCLIIIHERSTEPFFFVSTNVRKMAAFSRAERVFVQEQESPLLS